MDFKALAYFNLRQNEGVNYHYERDSFIVKWRERRMANKYKKKLISFSHLFSIVDNIEQIILRQIFCSLHSQLQATPTLTLTILYEFYDF